MNTSISKHHLIKPLCAAALLSCTPLAFAAGAVTPGAGAILQQIQQTGPAEPSTTNTGLQLQPTAGSHLPASAPFLVKRIQITGNSSFSTAILHALVSDAEGKSLTLPQVNVLATRITDYYHNHGYPLSRAIVPAQTIQNGVVQIEVIEARYGQVSLSNSSRVQDGLLNATLAPLVAGSVISQAAMDSSLLLLTDVPGVNVNATLQPGATVGSSDMVVEATPTPFLSGSANLDNYGNAYTGRVRAGGTLNIIDPLHHGDVLSLTGLTSGVGLNYADINYETLLNGEGTRLGAGYSALKYVLGGPLANVDGNGTAKVSSVWAKQPLLRSVSSNVYSKIEFDYLQLQDNLNNNAIQAARSLNNLTASVYGDSRDTVLGGGVNTWNMTGTAGRVSFTNAAAQQTDATGLATQGAFAKWDGSFNRLQTLSQSNALYVSISGQLASTNLDPSQQLIAGGPYSVRAYDMGVLSGDSGYLGTVELRHQLGQHWNGQWQALAFVDSEYLNINTNQGSITGANSATLSGAGVGLNWAGPYQLSATTYVATPIGPTPTPLPAGKSVLGWIQISKGF